MDAKFFKDITISRGFSYRYFYSLPRDHSLPTLLFLHDFPTTSLIWRRQIVFFQDHGFGIIAPDMLGFGGTSKPTDPEAYRASLICKDLIDIFDAERIDCAIAIGHGLGSTIVSRLANLHGNRFLGCGFLAVPYCAPRPSSSMAFTLEATKKMCGYELVGHKLFFSQDDSAEIIQNHLESFYSAMFPDDPMTWVTDVGPIGALKIWLEAGRQTPFPSYITIEDQDAFVKSDFTASLCWFKAQALGISADDDKSVPLEKYKLDMPAFFCAARHDYLARSLHGIAMTNVSCKNVCIREFNEGRWLIMSAPAEVNNALYSWIMDVV